MKKRLTLPSILAGCCLLAACQNPTPSALQHSADTDTDRAALAAPLMIGGYTGADADSSQGIYLTRVNADTALPNRFEDRQLLVATHNPSWLLASDKTGVVYAVDETGEGKIQVLSRAGQLLQSISSEGAAPCHLSLSEDGHWLAVSNYMGGNLAVYRVAGDGTLALVDSQAHSGHGPNADRQEAPHMHWAGWGPDGSTLYAVDLGIDKVMAYSFDAHTGRLGNGKVALNTAPGAGPRHLLFHANGRDVYLINELDNTVQHLLIESDSRLTSQQVISTLPADFSGHSQAAHIASNRAGDRLYISNRGFHSIAVYSVADDGSLKLLQLQSSLGDWPRHFSLLEYAGLLVVANEHSNQLVLFSLNEDGTLAPIDSRLPVGAPTFVGPY